MKKKDAVTRAQEMMGMPMGNLPVRAWLYSKFLSLKYGFCGEVLMTAYAAYAQKIEGLSCDDSLYKVDEGDWDDFSKTEWEIKPKE